MTLNNVLKLICLIGILCGSEVWAELSPEFVIKELREKYTQKAVSEIPDLSPDDFRISFVNRSLLFQLPQEAERLELNFPARGTVIGRTVIPLILYDKYNDVVDQIQLITDVDADRIAFRTKRELKRHEKIRSDDLIPVKASIQNLPYGTVFKEQEIVGKETNTIIQKGSIVTEQQVRSVPIIHQGDHVTVALINQGMALKVDAVALDEGQIGDTIRVQTQWKTKKIMKGVILDSSQVKVDIN